MHHPSLTTEKDLVLIGGGHAHVTVIKQFAMRPVPGVRLTVISRDLLAPYSGMLPGYIAGHYSLYQCHIDLMPLVNYAKGRFIHADVVGLDTEQKLIHCRDRAPIPYDITSINIGSSPDLSGSGNGDTAVIPVKPIAGFVAHWQRLHKRILSSNGDINIAVAGAGAGGVELTLAMQYRLQEDIKRQQKNDLRVHFHLFDRNSEVLASHNRKVRAQFQRILKQRNIAVYLNRRIVDVDQGQLRTDAGENFAMDEVLWVTRASAQRWLRDTALVLSPDGFISVDPTLQSVSHPDVFAAGDIAQVIAHPRPKAGVFAVRQGLPLSRNLCRALKSKTPQPFRPQAEFLSLISTGDKQAVASRAQWMFSGKWMWRWKDWIDRRFMNKFNRLPPMDEAVNKSVKHPVGQQPEQSLFASPLMYCGGCGSKVSQSVLQNALRQLSIRSRPDIVQGLQHPDDAAVVKAAGGELHVHTVDYFSAFIDDPFLFGKICAEHALSDLYAMGAKPQTALAITTLARQSETLQQRELQQLLSGAIVALDHCGAILVGGHTNCGDTLALGFAVNGTVAPDELLHKTGLQSGDKLILTKALGTGTIFAAHMRNKACGVWVDNALISMQLSNRDAADIFHSCRASACTDITGFGLLGHIKEMLGDDALAVKLSIAQLPIIQGALDSLNLDIVSSAQAQNQQVEPLLADSECYKNHVHYPLLFDPQTSGGLLAGIPADQAAACINQLHNNGYGDAMVIGEVVTSTSGKPYVQLNA